jgi:hypothetical protein
MVIDFNLFDRGESTVFVGKFFFQPQLQLQLQPQIFLAFQGRFASFPIAKLRAI